METLPLDGIRVLDFSHVWAGPFCARLLGDFGAEVIKIESVSRYDPERGPAKITPDARLRLYPDGEPGERPYNRAGRFNSYNRSKIGLTLDLRSEDGKALMRDLVEISDVVVENFSVGVMKRLGLDYDECRKLRPDIIYIALPGFGSDGPEAGYAAYGLTQEAMSGLSGITGYPGEVPIDTGVFYGDPTGGLFGATAVMTALWHRRMTGEGQRIDLSQREAFASILPELVFDHTMNDRVQESIGNRHPQFAPHGVYPCLGDDSWIAISVTTDVQFQALCEAIGHPSLVEDSRYFTMSSRLRNQDDLDLVIGEWTSRQDQNEAMQSLQSRGIPAGAVLTNQQLLEDPHFEARGFFEEATHPDTGTHRYIGMPWKLSDTPVHIRLPSPGLGEHNDHVLGEILGVTSEKLRSLEERDVIGDVPLTARD
ncbi:MAG: CoA transferase [SAR202 cluster bacterium]|jgi:crotonobetainyl-CoA:carnitine CoA-transferase CaiB-like acyl-CoA transferase|nr:CoA transferase [SAR202 cluster bacterium]MDP6514936.1 CoA transferase [SAR202 cluster bacterium]MDP6714802.1 CoA transferase [SAR202 cluster bacterium]